MTADDWTSLIVLGFILGALGQFIRFVMGFYKLKVRQTTGAQTTQGFSTTRMIFSLAGGACAGALAAIGLDSVTQGQLSQGISADAVGALFAAGYAGTDFIEGFIRSRVPTV